MSKRKTRKQDIDEVLALSGTYSVQEKSPGCYLIEDWLFVYPKNGKWGERYRQSYGYYDHGKLREFVEKAIDRYELSGHYKGTAGMKVEVK